jgi:hypothetical protein
MAMSSIAVLSASEGVPYNSMSAAVMKSSRRKFVAALERLWRSRSRLR